MGADEVIDYTEEDFTKSGETYDIIFDTVGKTSFSCSKDSLKQKGIYLAANGSTADYVQVLLTSMIGSKKVIAEVSSAKKEDLIFLKELIEAGKIKSVIDKRYPFHFFHNVKPCFFHALRFDPSKNQIPFPES